MTKLDELLSQFNDKQPEALLPVLQQIRHATELSAALQAHAFFTNRRGFDACTRLSALIQKLTTRLCHEHENKQN
jgi:hypothetical protein